ncbi:MAG: hypothetical protein ACLRT4_10730 [Thomasclavelia sp.]
MNTNRDKLFLDFEEALKKLTKAVYDIDISKNDSIEEQDSSLDTVKKEFNTLLDKLSTPTKNFKIEIFLKELKLYLDNNHRLLYSEFTNMIITCNVKNEQKTGNIISNLENCIEFSMDEGNSIPEITRKTLIKLWDHANLASNQYNYFMTTDDVYIAKVKPLMDSKIDELKEEVKNAKNELNKSNKEVKDIKSNLMSDLIAMISIFVAIAFVMFGGMSLLNSLFDFSNMNSIPVNELLCIGSLFGIIMITVLYAFMIFILKITDKEITGTSLLNKILITMIAILFIVCAYTFCRWKSNIETINKNSTNQQTIEIIKTVSK